MDITREYSLDSLTANGQPLPTETIKPATVNPRIRAATIDNQLGLASEAYNGARYRLVVINGRIEQNRLVLKRTVQQPATAREHLGERLRNLYRPPRPSTTPAVLSRPSIGAAPPDLPMQRMLLVLKRAPQQDFALRKLIDDQQDKASPNYHKWLTPNQFGNQFGASDQDMQLITGWLQLHGFQVNRVSQGRTVIEFSGVEAQVEQAFHTQIHQYLVNGEQHWANASDPQIPAALVPAVAGVRIIELMPPLAGSGSGSEG